MVFSRFTVDVRAVFAMQNASPWKVCKVSESEEMQHWQLRAVSGD